MLHEPIEKRLLESNITGEELLKVLKGMAIEASENDMPCLDTVVTFVEEWDEFVPGTYVPELHLIIRRVDESNT